MREGRRRAAGWASLGGLTLAGLWAIVGSCTPGPGPGPVAPAPAPAGPVVGGGPQPDVRVGLVVGAATATVGGGGGLAVADSTGAYLARIAPGEIWRVQRSGTGLSVVSPAGGGSTPAARLAIVPDDSEAPVLVNGRPYRGAILALRDRTGLTLVNRVPMERYLAGVVSAEMGRRSPSDQEALRAQAVVSRTYALRNRGRWAPDGFDVYAGVADQVYGGLGAETPEGLEAVASTRGQILTYAGAPIDAFFYSTCGGRTAEGPEVFPSAARPYLHSVPDLAADGTAYCSISPRFRWREEWSGDALRATLRRTLPAALGVAAGAVQTIRDVRVTAITASGRVSRVAIGLDRTNVEVQGPLIRQVFRSPSGDLLRSNTFTLVVTGAGRNVTRLVADGAGAGHGVGLCQWGAVGRSRAGQDYQQILAAYYSGARLERLY